MGKQDAARKYTRTNVEFDADIYKQMKEYCDQDGGRSIKSLIQEAVLIHIRTVKPTYVKPVSYAPSSELIDIYEQEHIGVK